MTEYERYTQFIAEKFNASRDDISCDLENSIRESLRAGVEPVGGFRGIDGRWYGRWS